MEAVCGANVTRNYVPLEMYSNSNIVGGRNKENNCKYRMKFIRK